MTLLNKIKDGLDKIFTKLENSVGSLGKVAIGLLVLAATLLTGSVLFSDKSEITNSTVMITTMSGNSGGSGSVIYSSENRSLVLTNKHVCEIALNGGLVKTTSGQTHTILSFKESAAHDLCLITVASKLPGKVSLATSAPKMYELATVSGHPGLLPNVVTQGHFSGNKVINVFLGMRKCTEEESKSQELGLPCAFFGGLPVFHTYEAVLVTATIMPGSSGSAIYNSSKELSAVVFAGSGQIGYAFAVPFEYVNTFLNEELKKVPTIIPNYNIDIQLESIREQTKRRTINKIVRKCEEETDSLKDSKGRTVIENFCQTIIRDSNWRN